MKKYSKTVNYSFFKKFKYFGAKFPQHTVPAKRQASFPETSEVPHTDLPSIYRARADNSVRTIASGPHQSRPRRYRRLIEVLQQLCSSRFHGYFVSNVLLNSSYCELQRSEIYRTATIDQLIEVEKSLVPLQYVRYRHRSYNSRLRPGETKGHTGTFSIMTHAACHFILCNVEVRIVI